MFEKKLPKTNHCINKSKTSLKATKMTNNSIKNKISISVKSTL